MKNLIIFALLFGIELSSFGQVQAIFPKYNSPSKEELKELAFQENAKGFAFRKAFVENTNVGLNDTTYKVSVTRLNEFFDHLSLEEVYLEEGGYKNSGWNPVTQKIVQSTGHKWTGFAWVFRIGSFSIIVIKGDCGNILAVPVTKIQNNQSQYQIPKQNIENVNNNNNNYIPSDNTIIVRTGATFVPDYQPAYYNNYPNYNYSDNSFVVRTGAAFYPNYSNYGYNYNYSGYSNNCNHQNSCSHNHSNGYSNNHSSGNSYYGHRN